MRLAEFIRLCQAQWTDADRPHGDVLALHLTDDSVAELSSDVMASGEAWLHSGGSLTGPETGKAPDSCTVRKLPNPVTRSLVDVTGGADSDTYKIGYAPGSPVKIITVGPAGEPCAQQETRTARHAAYREALAVAAATQRESAEVLRGIIGMAVDDGVTWREIGDSLGMQHATVFRQFKAGSPIVVVQPHQNRKGATA